MAAAVLAVFTLFVDVLMAQGAGIHGSVILTAALAATCLVVITPFDALETPARKRVVLACAAFLALILTASLLALRTSPEAGPMGALVALTAAGAALLIWAYKTRNRVRRSVWSSYYDM